MQGASDWNQKEKEKLIKDDLSKVLKPANGKKLTRPKLAQSESEPPLSKPQELTSSSETSSLCEHLRKEIKIDSIKCQMQVDRERFPGCGDLVLPMKRPRDDDYRLSPILIFSPDN